MSDTAPDLFDRRRRMHRRARTHGGDWLGQQIAAALLERLDVVTRTFTRALVIGRRDDVLIAALHARDLSVDVAEPDGGGGLGADEDILDVAPGSYDLIIWPGGLESVNDVPGALLRARLALKPDGLILGALIGDGSLPMLRTALRDGAIASGRPLAARMMPQMALGALGDLLQRVGLALSVVDVDELQLRYREIDGLVRDLRAHALTALLAGPVPPLNRNEWAATSAAFGAAGEDGFTTETIRIIHFSGWAPDASQPQPARRGSATASLAAALQKGGQTSG
jgi:NADH dehydrogenase [ubiquinone] 1 alpha subcomplex assembly factor 5